MKRKHWKQYWKYKTKGVVPDEMSFDRVYYERAERLLSQPIHSLCYH